MSIALLALAALGPPAQAALGAPLPPLAVQAAVTGDGTLVTWLPPADEGASPVAAYRVHRLSSLAGPWEEIGATDAGTLSFLDPSPSALAAYAVTAENAEGSSPQSVPAATGLWCTVADASSSQAVIGWECFGPARYLWYALPDGDPLANWREGCGAFGLSGTPPQPVINWDCIGDELPPVRTDFLG